MNKTKVEEVAAQLFVIAEGLKFGSVSVTVKFFGGHLTTIAYAKTEQTMEQEKKKDNEKIEREIACFEN